MKILVLLLHILFCFNAHSEYQGGQSYYVQEHFAKTGSSGYIFSEDQEIKPRTAVEVYELSSYRHNHQAPQPQPSQPNYDHSYQNQHQQQYYQPAVQSPQSSRGILSPSTPPQRRQPAPPSRQNQYQQHPVSPQPSRGIFSRPQVMPQQQPYRPQEAVRNTAGNAMAPVSSAQQMYEQQMHASPATYSNIARQVGAQAMQSSKHKSLFGYKKYYAANLGHPFKSAYKFTEGSTSETLSQNGFIPIANKNGIVGLYVGKRMQKAQAIRYEYGLQWEILSFEQKVKQGLYEMTYGIYSHNVGASLRSYFDIPLSLSTFFSLGLEGNYGVLSNIVAGTQSFSTGLSHAFLAGMTKQISKSRAIYLLLRQGVIPNKKYEVVNAVRATSMTSTSIIIGLHVVSQ